MKFKLLSLFKLVLLRLVLLLYCVDKISCIEGAGVCTRDEQYTVNVQVSQQVPYHVREMTWCLSLPSYKCSKYTVKYRTEFMTQKITKKRPVEECCDGIALNSNGTVCLPICSNGCFHGICEAPSICKCERGFGGPNCNISCPQGSWGEHCDNKCECHHDADCDPLSGECICAYGKDCSTDKECTTDDCVEKKETSGAEGTGVCINEKQYNITIRVSEQKPFQIRQMTWCLSFPAFKCSNYKISYKTEFKTQIVTKTKPVEECCKGFVLNSNGTACLPVCSSACVHGICEAPNICKCERGYEGPNCNMKTGDALISVPLDQ